MQSKRSRVKKLLLVFVVGVVALALLAFAVLRQTGAATAEEAASRFLTAAASGDRLAAHKVHAHGIVWEEDGSLVFGPDSELLSRARLDFFGRDTAFDVRTLELDTVSMPANNEGGSEGFAVQSYQDASGTSGTAPDLVGEGPAVIQVRLEGDRWFVSGY